MQYINSLFILFFSQNDFEFEKLFVSYRIAKNKQLKYLLGQSKKNKTIMKE